MKKWGMKCNQKSNQNHVKPMRCRALAAVLAGLMLMSFVPSRALAEAADEAQATPVSQQDSASSDASAQATATEAAPAAADNDSADSQQTAGSAQTADGQQTTDGQQMTDGQQTTDGQRTADSQGASDQNSGTVASSDSGSIDSNESLAPATSAISASAPQNVKVNSAESNATETSDSGTSAPWSDYNGPTSTDDTVSAVKQLFSFVGAVWSGKTGDAITAVLGFSTKPVSYSNNQLMHQLWDMENQVTALSSQVYQFQSSFNTALAELKKESAFSKIDGFNNYLSKDGTGLKYALATLNNELPKYYELDADGNVTTTPCSLTTSVDRMPAQAREIVKNVASYLDKQAQSTCGASNTENVEQVLARRICDSDNNLVKAQFDALDNTYNWDEETFATKKEFLAWIGQMYMNAYVAESIVLNAKLADSESWQADSIRQELKNLGDRAAAVSEALYGDNGFIKRAEPQGENQVTCYVNNKTYTKGTYAKVSAYKRECFEQAYADGKPDDADKVATSWSVDSTFSADELCEMISRFNALKNAGLAPTLEGSDTKAEDVVQEMAAVGFKNVETAGNEEGTTWASRLSAYKGWQDHMVGSDVGKYASLTNVCVELGDPNQTNQINEESEFRMGERLTNSEDWVVTKVKRARVDGGSAWWGSHYKTYACYGEVVNIKTGRKIDDQLLYVLKNYNPDGAWSPCNWHYTSTLEYYAFGALRLGTEDATIK